MIELPNVAALYVFLAFGICYWILRKFLFVPLSGILDAREAAERDAEKRYTQSLAELERAVAAGEEKLSEARREALKTREALRAEGAALLDAKLGEAHDAGAPGRRSRGQRDRDPVLGLRAGAAGEGARDRPRARRKDPRTKARGVILSGWTAVLDAARIASEEGHEASKFLGLPLWIWQLLNLGLFLAVLLYFVAKPLGDAFRKRQLEIEERRKEAEKQRASVERLASDIRERTAKVEREIEEIRKQGRADGEEARRSLAAKADEEGARIRKDAEEEIDRRVVAARDELRRAAADIAGKTASEILTREITSGDRERLLAEGLSSLKEGAR